ncbi:MAG TPA: hypothetical protein VLH60_05520 [Sedimentisphaerales bacterium]|nr:hypothetical protein [Sedimentisphaerales bacterium]
MSDLKRKVQPRNPQGEKHKGSQLWLQKVINDCPELLNSQIRKAFVWLQDEQITWVSPLREDEYSEYRDEGFVERLGLKLEKQPLSGFWPRGGPQWDGLGMSGRGSPILVEAKGHVGEMAGPGSQATYESSVERIAASLERIKEWLSVNPKDVHIDWRTGPFYQYVNRLAHLYLLRELNGIDAKLLFVDFVGDTQMHGPECDQQWDGAVSLVHKLLGIRTLPCTVGHICCDLNKVRNALLKVA